MVGTEFVENIPVHFPHISDVKREAAILLLFTITAAILINCIGDGCVSEARRDGNGGLSTQTGVVL